MLVRAVGRGQVQVEIGTIRPVDAEIILEDQRGGSGRGQEEGRQAGGEKQVKTDLGRHGGKGSAGSRLGMKVVQEEEEISKGMI